MLESIKIKNYALIDEIEIEFDKGFNVFTGESGAGKSIIVDSLGFCLGERATPSIIKTGKDKTIVEAVFLITNPRIREKIEKLGFNLENERIIVRREYEISGRNKVTVNGFHETLSRVSELSEILVDFHGQHDHQSLLNQKTHIDYLDSFGKFNKELKEVSELYNKALELKNKIKELEENLSQKKTREEFLKYTIEELKNSNLRENEDVELEEKFNLITNYENLYNILQESILLLSENETSALLLMGRVANLLKSGIKLNPLFENLSNSLEESQIIVKNVVSELKNLLEKINFQPEEVERVNSRLDQIRTLKRKYNKNSVNELMLHLKETEEELSRLEFSDKELLSLKEEYNKTIAQLKRTCIDLSEKRINKSKELDKKVEEKLKHMAMEKAIFKTDFKYYKDENGIIEINGVKVDVNEKGVDRVEFLISINPGEELKPLRHVASGGEISRIMLAIKSVLADVSEVDMMVFDEIDVGIGGHTANVVGEIIKSMAQKQQVIVITHLPQVASKANSHFMIEKIFDNNETRVVARKLSDEERKYEIARMIGNETDTGIKYAEELLKRS
ncbi:MAG: DNA repair protein RecN [Brevinematia bacterium]